MSDGYLIARLLDLDVLIGDEARGLDLEEELTVDFVGLALVRGALHNGIELLGVDKLVDLKAASIASIDGHLHAWLDVTCTRHNASHCHQLANVLGLHISHLHYMLLGVLTVDEHALVVALELGRDSADRVRVCSRVLSRDNPLLKFELTGHLQIKSSLLHDHIKAGLVLVAEVKTRLGHVRIDHFLE